MHRIQHWHTSDTKLDPASSCVPRTQRRFPGSGCCCTCPTCSVVAVVWEVCEGVGGTHDSGGIPPSLPALFNGVSVAGWAWEAVTQRRDVGTGHQPRCRSGGRRHLLPDADHQPSAGPGGAEDLLRSSDPCRNSECLWFFIFFFLSFFLIQFLSRRDLARRCSRRSCVANFAADVSGDTRAECSPAGLFPGLQWSRHLFDSGQRFRVEWC